MEKALMEQYRTELSITSIGPFYDEAKKEKYLQYKINNQNLSWLEVITYVNIGLHEEFYQNTNLIADPKCITVLVNKYQYLSEIYIPEDLELINPCFNPEGLLLRKDAKLAFEEMCCAAFLDGIHLKAISTFRSYYYQWKVYLNKITPYISMDEYRAERDKVSARPGHSEHQTGLAVDINDLEQTFEDTPEGKWLAANSYQYGFVLRYPKGKEKITGYDYEPWHFRYLGLEMAKEVFYSESTYDEFYTRYIEQASGRMRHKSNDLQI